MVYKMTDRNHNAKLQAIATTGFDAIANNSSESVHQLTEEHPPVLSDAHSPQAKQPEPPPTCLLDHPKLLSNNFHFLKGVDLHHPILSHEMAFAEAVATRNNPTTMDNIRTKLTSLPPNFASFSKEQQTAYLRLVDCAEMKQTLKYELKNKEKLVRDLEMRYLSADFGLGNVVHGWDLTGNYGVADRQVGTPRVVSRRKIKDGDRIFSSSSVMSFTNPVKTSETHLPEIKKKKEKMQKKKQISTLNRMQSSQMEMLETEDEPVERTYTVTEKKQKARADNDDILNVKQKLSKKKNMVTKKPKNSTGYRDIPAGGKHSLTTSVTTKTPKTPTVSKPPEKPPMETGHRLRTLLTNKAPHAASSSFTKTPVDSFGSGRDQGGSIKLKIFKTRAGIQSESSEVPPSPAASITPVDSNPETPSTPNPLNTLSKRQRGRPPRRLAE
ncbi:uncharacterized protein LOC129593620 [Paramacrobiotus metropolitanus]|uniref:uncharacterized protein LOC129593620 n=1 Tax=Paramacrobiotus metropolitanus TaxID=2943436 RepID=UPI002445F4F0|nr:uncharacterized protein LOC129593620 [Paramacrobiotus metropolitanus]